MGLCQSLYDATITAFPSLEDGGGSGGGARRGGGQRIEDDIRLSISYEEQERMSFRGAYNDRGGLGSVGYMRIKPDSGEIRFTLSSTAASSKAAVILWHPGKCKETLAFKILTNQPDRYYVSPSQGIINPGGSEAIEISLKWGDQSVMLRKYEDRGESALAEYNDDKFCVLSCAVSDRFASEYSSDPPPPVDPLSTAAGAAAIASIPHAGGGHGHGREVSDQAHAHNSNERLLSQMFTRITSSPSMESEIDKRILYAKHVVLDAMTVPDPSPRAADAKIEQTNFRGPWQQQRWTVNDGTPSHCLPPEAAVDDPTSGAGATSGQGREGQHREADESSKTRRLQQADQSQFNLRENDDESQYKDANDYSVGGESDYNTVTSGRTEDYAAMSAKQFKDEIVKLRRRCMRLESALSKSKARRRGRGGGGGTHAGERRAGTEASEVSIMTPYYSCGADRNEASDLFDDEFLDFDGDDDDSLGTTDHEELAAILEETKRNLTELSIVSEEPERNTASSSSSSSLATAGDGRAVLNRRLDNPRDDALTGGGEMTLAKDGDRRKPFSYPSTIIPASRSSPSPPAAGGRVHSSSLPQPPTERRCDVDESEQGAGERWDRLVSRSVPN